MAEASAASRAQSATRCRPASETASAVPQAPAPRMAIFMGENRLPPRTSVNRGSEAPDLTDLDVAGLAFGVAHPDPAARGRFRDIEGHARLPRKPNAPRAPPGWLRAAA